VKQKRLKWYAEASPLVKTFNSRTLYVTKTGQKQRLHTARGFCVVRWRRSEQATAF